MRRAEESYLSPARFLGGKKDHEKKKIFSGLDKKP